MSYIQESTTPFSPMSYYASVQAMASKYSGGSGGQYSGGGGGSSKSSGSGGGGGGSGGGGSSGGGGLGSAGGQLSKITGFLKTHQTMVILLVGVVLAIMFLPKLLKKGRRR